MSETTTAALTTGCALFQRPDTAPWEMPGEDRARFLNGLVTCPVQELAEGTGAYGFITSAKGRVLADVVVLAAGDRFLLELPASAAEAARDHLLKYRIADRVELEPSAGREIWTVVGPQAAATLAGLLAAGQEGAVPAAEWEHRRLELAGVPVRLARRGLAPVPAWDLWLPAEGGEAVRTALAQAGASVTGDAAWERLRVEAGVPRFGADFGPDNLPQETGLDASAVSYEKGCYLGQEVVARIHYRGGVNKGLVGLRLDGGEVAPGAGVSYDGRPAGTVGSVASGAPGDEPGIALAILHQRASEPGTVVEVEGGGEATVVSLPFGGA